MLFRLWPDDVIQTLTRWCYSGRPRSRRETGCSWDKLSPDCCPEVLLQDWMDRGELFFISFKVAIRVCQMSLCSKLFFSVLGFTSNLVFLSLIFVLHFFRTTEWTILVILFMDLDMLDFTRTSDKHQCIICCMNFMKSKFGSELIFWHIIPTALWVKCWSPKKWQWQRKSWCW